MTHSQEDREARIIESFSKYATSYDRHAQLQKSMAERLAAFLPEPLPENILEIGCGTGMFTRHLLARQVKNLLLNDIAPAMIKNLKSRNEVPANTQTILGNAETLDFPKVNMIVANAVFQWFQNPVATIKRLASFLDTGGQLVFSTFGPETLKEFREAGGFKSPITMHSFSHWETILREAGLRIIESNSEIRKVFFTDALTLTKNLQQIGAAPMRSASTGELKKLIRQYDKTYTTAQGVYSTWELYYFSTTHS